MPEIPYNLNICSHVRLQCQFQVYSTFTYDVTVCNYLKAICMKAFRVKNMTVRIRQGAQPFQTIAKERCSDLSLT